MNVKKQLIEYQILIFFNVKIYLTHIIDNCEILLKPVTTPDSLQMITKYNVL